VARNKRKEREGSLAIKLVKKGRKERGRQPAITPSWSVQRRGGEKKGMYFIGGRKGEGRESVNFAAWSDCKASTTRINSHLQREGRKEGSLLFLITEKWVASIFWPSP